MLYSVQRQPEAESEALVWVWATGGTKGLIETVRLKKMMECVWWRTSANTRQEWVPDWGSSDANNKKII